MPISARGHLAWEAFIESAVKAVAALAVSLPRGCEVILSGRLARVDSVRRALSQRLKSETLSVQVLSGFAAVAKHAAQGAALVADGLVGGRSAPLVASLGIREAHGTVLDHLFVISPADARARLGIP
jgi:predicted butyrate kinase (DUF1464 family)